MFIASGTHLVPVTYLPLDPFLQSFIYHCISGSKECIKLGSWGMVLATHCFLQDTVATGLPSAAGVILGRTEVWSVCGHPALHITVLKDVNIFLGKRTLSDLSISPSSWFPCPNFSKQHPQSLSIGSHFSSRNAFILHDILCICFLFSVPFPHSIQPHRHLEYKLHETKDCFIYCHFSELDCAGNMGHICWMNGW